MCCIIHRKKDSKEIPQSNLEKIIKINPDGWGVSFMNKARKLRVVKSLNMAEAIDYLRKLEKDNVEFLFHARYATHGLKIVENCHPYDLYDGVLFHNGKIDIKCPNKRYSDTYYFSVKVSKAMRRGRPVESIVNTFKPSIGPSRLAFMSKKGVIKKFGHWYEIDGHSYSKNNWQSDYGYYGDLSEYYHESGYSNYARSSHSYREGNKRKVTEFSPNLSSLEKIPENIFKRILKNANYEDGLFTHELKKLSEAQLNTIAKKFPKLCAEYLWNQMNADIPF